ncbi:MAG: sugar ABC transporter ATP-binding protein [Tepidisphaeraceae bacterium]
MAGPAMVATRSLTKDYSGVRALNDVSLEFSAGEVHGIVGENGAGKSTLAKVLCGVERPSAGQVLVSGVPVEFRRPLDALRLRIAMIHQELNLIDDLNVAENIFLGRERTTLGLVATRDAAARSREILRSLESQIDPRTPVRDLAIADKQIVEITKALSLDARLLIMDEPTAVLSARETDALHRLIRRLRASGVCIIYVSHILPDVLRLCDRVTVMRDGRVVTTLHDKALSQTRERDLASLMVGRPMSEHFPRLTPPGSGIALRVAGLSVAGRVHGVSFELRRGEILGFAGLIGAGRTDMAEAIVGLRARTSGSTFVDGARVQIRNLRDAVAAGIVYVSEDSKGSGLTLGMSIVENITMVSLGRYARLLISRRAQTAAARLQTEQLQVRAVSLHGLIDTLSGGNQQKVALGKWLQVQPRVLILDEPTRGVDVGAKEEIYRLIHSLASSGMACMFISSELNEVLGMCHRIAVMRNGQIQTILDAADATEQIVMGYAAGVTSGAAA